MISIQIVVVALPLIALAGFERPAVIGDRADVTTVFEFETANEATWQVVNDGGMGGRSQGFVEIKSGTLRFTGMLVTRGGGFTSVRTARPADLRPYDGLEVRVRGGGRVFEVEIDDGTRQWSRSVSRRARVQPTTEWTTIRVPFSAFRATIFGRGVEAPPMDLANVEGFGLYILDGKDGPFRLEVDAIRAYRADS